MTNGNDILIYIDGALVAGTRSDEIQTNGEQIEIASQQQGRWREFIAGRNNWTFQQSWLMSAGGDLRRLFDINKQVTVRIFPRGVSSWYLQGYAFIQTCRITAVRGNLTNGSFVFRGNGALTIVE